MPPATSPGAARQPLGRTSPVLKLGIALVWLIGLATTTAWAPPVVLTIAAVFAALAVGRVPTGDLGAGRRAAVARRARPRVLQHDVRRRERRPDRHDDRHRRAVAGHPGGAPGRRRARVAGRVDRCRRGGLRADHGLDAAGRCARPAGAGARAVRLRGPGRLRRDPALRVRPREPAGGAPAARAPWDRGTRGSSSACWSSPSATATGWPLRWTPGRSDQGRDHGIGMCGGRGWTQWSASQRSGSWRSLSRPHAEGGAGSIPGCVSAPPRRATLVHVIDSHTPAETRIDRWLCAVRLVKTRPLATRLCEGSHVRVNGALAKPSTKVRAGDRVEALIADRDRVVEVVQPIETRVGASVAATCYHDHTPPPAVTEVRAGISAVRGEGRPSKRLRRELERLRRAPDT